MKRKDGTIITPNGPMVARLVYAEPELWDLVDRKSKMHGITRSTGCRIAMKKTFYVPTIKCINWEEKFPESCK